MTLLRITFQAQIYDILRQFISLDFYPYKMPPFWRFWQHISQISTTKRWKAHGKGNKKANWLEIAGKTTTTELENSNTIC